MRYLRVAMMASAVGLIGQSPVQGGVGSDPIDDVRCVVVGMRISSLADRDQRSAGLMTELFFLGGLDSIVPRPDIRSLIVKVSEEMTTVEFKSEAVRCGKVLSEKGQELQDVSDEIQKNRENKG